ncbi:MAG TPA: class I SAM-dependent methyltransferase [Rhabdochlamydiaceae bacterium]|nr:class I SAM-dependent methyltransferase [Rhabdochlamydiaceae bacterium]
MHKFLLALFCLTIQHLFGEDDGIAKRLKYSTWWNYQSIIVNGKVVYDTQQVSGGEQIIWDRYTGMKQVLDQYKRPFTVLDIGANNGFFSLKIAEDYDACCVMVDVSQRLTDICTLNTDRNKIIHFKKKFSLADIKKLTKEEHFDVILVPYVLHHVKDGWEKWFETLLTLGDQIIISIPCKRESDPEGDISRMEKYFLEHKEGHYLGKFSRGDSSYGHMIWFCANPKSFEEKSKHPFGIKPSTYSQFNGNFPSPAYVSFIDRKLKKKHGKNNGWVLQGVDYYLPTKVS